MRCLLGNLIALAIVVVSVTCFGQVHYRMAALQNGSSGQSPPANPESILPVGMRYWYTARDLTSSPVTNWTDRVSGYHFWQTNSSLAPTWVTNDGVHFNGVDQRLFATNLDILNAWGNGWPFLAVFRYDNTRKNSLLLGNGNGGGQFYIDISDTPDYLGGPSSGSVGPMGNGIYDLIGCQTNYNTFFSATNGVRCINSTASWPSAQVTYVGYGGSSLDPYANVTLMEWIVWTNSSYPTFTNYWTLTTISNVHWYATNRWPHSP